MVAIYTFVDNNMHYRKKIHQTILNLMGILNQRNIVTSLMSVVHKNMGILYGQ